MTSVRSFETDEPSIVKWCQKQTFFVTGGSGFLGKALVFKLLKCGAPKIYVLIRTKKGRSGKERLENMMNHEIYEPLRNNDPDLRSKVEAMEGDVTEPGLALSEEDVTTIKNEVTVIFNVAASVKFDDPLKAAVHYNLRSTRDLVELAKQVKNLEVFHHVSTGYSNCENLSDPNGIEERMYPTKMDYEKLIDFVDSTPEPLVEALKEKLLGSSVNTYVFTKHLAESVVADSAHLMPTVISRPQVVLPGLYEPYPGWLDNISSPLAIVGGCGKGVLRVYIGPPNAPRAYVAVDMAINSIIVASWHQARLKGELFIYNMDYNPISSSQLKNLCFSTLNTHPLHGELWTPRFHTVQTQTTFLIAHLLLHLLPGIIFDMILRLSGRQPRLVRLYQKLYMAFSSLLPFLEGYDNFVHDNFDKLIEEIPQEEKEMFLMAAVKDKEEYQRYIHNCNRGFRRLIGDPVEITKEDIAHHRRMLILDYVVQGVLIVAVLWNIPYVRIYNYLDTTIQAYIQSIIPDDL